MLLAWMPITPECAALPRTLDIRGSIAPSQCRHGLYNVTVHELAAQLNTSFDIMPPTCPAAPPFPLHPKP
jgi:hypothetical protein